MRSRTTIRSPTGVQPRCAAGPPGSGETSDDAAAHLGIKRRTLYNLADSRDDFPRPKRVNRTLLWAVDELDAWRKNHPARKRSTTS